MKLRSLFPLFWGILILFSVLPLQAQVDLSRIAPHPRLLLPKGGEKVLLKRINSDPMWQAIHAATLGEADRIVALPTNERIKIGMRLLRVSRENVRRIFILSYAYRMSGNKKYLHRAEAEMLKAASFSDWNPSHFLDVGEMTMALGIGYDWLYGSLSETTRKTVREAIIEKGFTPSFDTAYNWFVGAEHNWNQVCNTGLSYGAIAIAESAPEVSTQILNRAVDKIKLPMRHYAPEGGYPEGLSYWGYGTLFNVLFLGALESAFQTDFGLSQMPGFMQTGAFAVQMISPLEYQFNFMDNSLLPESSSAPFWFYSKLKEPSLLYQQARLLACDTEKKYLQDRALPAMILWGAGSPLSRPTLPTSTFWINRGDTPVTLMRSAWGDPNARFIGVKMGSPSTNHGHMDVGSFVFEADGVRWALDLGSENYASTEALGVNLWEMDQQSQRWDIFRYNNFSHNTLTFNGKKQSVTGRVGIATCDSAPAHRYVTMDLTPLYAGEVQRAQRAIALVDNDYAVIEDCVTTGKYYTRLQWTLTTQAVPKQLSANTVELEQAGKKCRLRVDTDAPIRWRFEKTPTINTFDSPNPGVTLVIFDCDLPREATTRFQVFLIPETAKATAPYTPLL